MWKDGEVEEEETGGDQGGGEGEGEDKGAEEGAEAPELAVELQCEAKSPVHQHCNSSPVSPLLPGSASLLLLLEKPSDLSGDLELSSYGCFSIIYY